MYNMRAAQAPKPWQGLGDRMRWLKGMVCDMIHGKLQDTCTLLPETLLRDLALVPTISAWWEGRKGLSSIEDLSNPNVLIGLAKQSFILLPSVEVFHEPLTLLFLHPKRSEAQTVRYHSIITTLGTRLSAS